MRRLGRDTFLYALATIASRLVSFVMLPVYTRFLTPADYGVLAILEVTMDVALILSSAGATAGLMRFYFKASGEAHRRHVLFTAWLTSTALHLAGTLVLLALAPQIWRHALGGAGSIAIVQLAAIDFTVASLLLVPLQMLSIDQRPVASSIVLLSKLVLQLGLNVLFVVGFRLGPIGILWSTFFAAGSVGLFMSVVLLRRTGVAWSWTIFRELRRFALPIQIATAGTFLLTYGDRFILRQYHGLAVVGLYGLAYQFGFLVSGMLSTPFFQAWTPQRFQLAHEPQPRRDEIYNRGFLYGDVIVIGGATAICLFIRPVLMLMTTPQFHPAANVVPVLVLAYVFQVWTMVADFGIEVSEKTKYTSYATWISVVVIAALYFGLIPRFGGIGAAVATLIAMIVRFGCTLYFAQQVWPVAYKWGPHLRMLLAGSLVTTCSFLSPIAGAAPLAFQGVAGFAAYAAWVWKAVLRNRDRVALVSLAKSPSSFRQLLRDGPPP